MSEDDDLLSLVSTSFDEVAATPVAALDAARAAFGMRDLHGELAELIFDSWRQEDAAAVRSAAQATQARLLSFAVGGQLGSEELTVDVELHPDGATLLGQVSPEGLHTVVVELAGGTLSEAATDDFGRFRCVAPLGAVRLHVDARLVTPWISR